MNNTKEHILKTAYLLFLQKSFKAVTMKEIVDKTQLSKGAFYHYFNSKEDVFEEVVNNYFLKFLEIDYDHLSHDSLHAFYKDYLETFFSDRSSFLKQLKDFGAFDESLNFYLLIFEAFRLMPDFKSKIRKEHERELKEWTNIIRIARENGEIRPEVSDKELAKLFIFSGDGLGMRRLMDNDLNSIKEELTAIYDGIYSLLKA